MLNMAQRAAGIVVRTAAELSIRLEDLREEEPNAFYGQVSKGLWITTVDDAPRSFLTPWGEWRCFGRTDALYEKRLDLLEAIGKRIIVDSGRSDNRGHKAFRIISVETSVLPQGEQLTKYRPYYDVRAEMLNELKKRAELAF